MRVLMLLLVLVLGACSRPSPAPAHSPAMLEGYRAPADVGGDIAVSIQYVKELTWPGRELRGVVRYTNVAPNPVWIEAHPSHRPLYSVELRAKPGEEWLQLVVTRCLNPIFVGEGYPRIVSLRPGESHVFEADIPDHYEGREFRILVRYRTMPEGDLLMSAVSDGRPLVATVSELPRERRVHGPTLGRAH